MNRPQIAALVVSTLLLASCDMREPTQPAPQATTPNLSYSPFTLGGNPFGSVVSVNGTGWVSQLWGYAIKRFDVATGAITGTVNMGANILPVQLSANLDGSRIYVSSFDEDPEGLNEGLVASINTSTLQIVSSKRLTGDATGMLATPTGDTVIVGITDGPLYRLAMGVSPPATIASRIDLATAYAWHFAWAPGRTSVYASSAGAHAVYKLNAANLETQHILSMPGKKPQGIALSADGNTLYVAAEAGDVLVWNVAANPPQQLATIPTGCQGYGILRHPAYSQLYVSCTLNGKIVVVNPISHVKIVTYTVGGYPRELSYDPGTGKVIAPNEFGWVDLITPPVELDDAWKAPFGSVVTADGAAWISQLWGFNIKKLNVATGAVMGTVSLGENILPVQLSANLDGSRIYVSSFDEDPQGLNEGLVASINTATLQIVSSKRLTGDATGMLATPTGDTVIVGITDGPLYRLWMGATPPATIALREDLPTAYAWHFAWGPGRTSVYASSAGADAVYRLNAATLATERTLSMPGKKPQGITLSADNSKLYVAAEAGDIMVWNIAVDPPQQLANIVTGCRGYGLVRTPNDRLYDSCTLDGKVVGIDLATGAKVDTQITTGRPRELSYHAGTGKVIVPNEYGWVDLLASGASPGPGPLPGHYVAPPPLGKSPANGGQGTYESPWDLQSALNGAGGQVTAGETVWLLGGIYYGKYSTTTSLRGTTNAPIVFREYPGVNAVIEDNSGSSTGETFVVRGDTLVFWGFEIWNSMDGGPNRQADRPNLIYNIGTYNKYINLVLHDGGVAITSEQEIGETFKKGAQFIGCIIYNNGYQGADPDRGHGHGMYLINNNSSDSIVAYDNVIFNQFSHGIHVYTDPNRNLYNMKLRRNVVFNNGTLAQWTTSDTSLGRNILVGGNGDANGAVLDSNMTYYSPDDGTDPPMGENVEIGYQLITNGTIQVVNNYFVGGGALTSGGLNYSLLDIGYWNGVTMSGNSFIMCQPILPSCDAVTTKRLITLNDATTNGHSWSNNTHYRAPSMMAWRWNGGSFTFSVWKDPQHANLTTNDTPVAGTPSTNKVVVREVLNGSSPTGRANIVVYNWGNSPSVTVDLTNIVPSGKPCQIRNVLALQTVIPGCTSGPVSITLAAVPPPPPQGQTVSNAPATGTRFNVYTVDWTP